MASGAPWPDDGAHCFWCGHAGGKTLGSDHSTWCVRYRRPLGVPVTLTDEQVADLRRRWDAVASGAAEREPISLVPVREPGDQGTIQPAARIVPLPAREPGAAFVDPPLCPVCKVNHVGWWITSKGQHFDPYCGACGFTPSDPYRADIDPVFRDQMLRRAIERSRG